MSGRTVLDFAPERHDVTESGGGGGVERSVRVGVGVADQGTVSQFAWTPHTKRKEDVRAEACMVRGSERFEQEMEREMEIREMQDVERERAQSKIRR